MFYAQSISTVNIRAKNMKEQRATFPPSSQRTQTVFAFSFILKCNWICSIQ